MLSPRRTGTSNGTMPIRTGTLATFCGVSSAISTIPRDSNGTSPKRTEFCDAICGIVFFRSCRNIVFSWGRPMTDLGTPMSTQNPKHAAFLGIRERLMCEQSKVWCTGAPVSCTGYHGYLGESVVRCVPVSSLALLHHTWLLQIVRCGEDPCYA